MSSGHNDHGHEHGQSQAGGADAVRYDMVIKVGIASLIIFAVSIWVAGMIWKDVMHTSEAKAGRARVFVDTHQKEIGIVDQVPFVTDTRLHEWRADRKRELEGYSWVDKAQGVVRIPIEEAMNKVAAGQLPAGAPK